MARNDEADWAQLDEVFYGCANQAGEDNRNVARMAVLLSGLPGCAGNHAEPALRVRPRCGRRGGTRHPRRRDRLRHRGRRREHDARALRHGQIQEAFGRQAEIHDTTIGWRFVNKAMKERYGMDSMPETGENVAQDFQVRAPTRTPSPCAASSGRRSPGGRFFAGEIVPVDAPGGKRRADHGRQGRASARRNDAEMLAKLKPIVRAGRHRDRRQCLRRERRLVRR